MPSGESPGVEAAPGTPPLVIVCDRDNPDDAGVGDAGGAAAKDPSTPPAGCAKAVKATPPKKKRKIFEKKLDEYPEEAETTFGSHDGPPKRRLKEKTSPESLSPPPSARPADSGSGSGARAHGSHHRRFCAFR